ILRHLGTQIFSLDLRDNRLTSKIVDVLLANNVLPNLRERRDLENGWMRCSNGQGEIEDRSVNLARYMEEPPPYRERYHALDEQGVSAITDGKVGMRPDSADEVMAYLQLNEQIHTIRET